MTEQLLKIIYFEKNCLNDPNNCTVYPTEVVFHDLNEAYPYLRQASLTEKTAFCTVSLTFIMVGLTLRGFIFGYLRSPSEASTVINTLIFVQQFCRYCGVCYFVWFATANLVPFSLEDAFGADFCSGFSALNSFSLFGDIYFSCVLALTRLIYIKYHAWLK